MPSFGQIIRELEERLAALEETVADEKRQRTVQNESFLYRFRRVRAEIFRLSTGASGERWHVGGVYTRGTRLHIPPRPPMLKNARTVPALLKQDALADPELVDVERNGIPRDV